MSNNPIRDMATNVMLLSTTFKSEGIALKLDCADDPDCVAAGEVIIAIGEALMPFFKRLERIANRVSPDSSN